MTNHTAIFFQVSIVALLVIGVFVASLQISNAARPHTQTASVITHVMAQPPVFEYPELKPTMVKVSTIHPQK